MMFWTGSITDCFVKNNINRHLTLGIITNNLTWGMLIDCLAQGTITHCLADGTLTNGLAQGILRGPFDTRNTNRLTETGNTYALFGTVIFAEINGMFT
jgi:hypothetical protein